MSAEPHKSQRIRTASMRLKRLELYGYKSFASRVTFEFPAGLTAIIGPNGSGKSNIADAIRWVTGEQSYRQLRASSSSDMIFSGSRTRARLGMCEVLVTLDNSDGSLPVAFSEVTIGRRAYRAGDNEYLLNGNRVRYRDILDLLGAAGIARSAYTVIGQGMVDAALALRPQARRALFEEAAGISPHLRRREEALKRIAETERNIERVSDILAELKPRARSLRRQAERAEESQLLRQDLQELQRIWYGYQWQRCQRDLAAAQNRLRDKQTQLTARRRYAAGFAETLDGIAEQLSALRQAIEDHRHHERDSRSQAEAIRRSIAVSGERDRLLRQQQEALETETAGLISRRDILSQEIDLARDELDQQTAALADARGELETLSQKAAAADAWQQSREEELEQTNKQLHRALATISQQQARQEQEQAEGLRLVEEQERAETQIGDLAARLERLAPLTDKHSQECTSLEQQVRDLEHQVADLRTHAVGTEERLATEAARLREASSAHEQLLSRQAMLERERHDATGYSAGVRTVVTTDPPLEGILGTVAELMRVPAEYEQAIESALGGRLQNLVTETWQHAEAAIALLKSRRGGWATFLPLDTVRPRSPLSPPRDKAVVGVASNLVRYDAHLRPVYELLLGRILVVRDLRSARRLLDNRTGASLLVTLDGETVRPSGAVSGGARRQRTNLLATERTWRQMPARIAAAADTLSNAQRCLATSEEELDTLRERIRDSEESILNAQRALRQHREALSRHGQTVDATERELAWERDHIDQLARRRNKLATQSAATLRDLQEAQADHTRLSGSVATLRQELQDGRDEGLRQRLAQLETRQAVAARTVESQRQLLASHRANLAQVEREADEKRRRHSDLAKELTLLAADKARAATQLEELQSQLDGIEAQIAPALAEVEKLEGDRRQTERGRAESLDSLHAAEMEHNEVLLQRDRLDDRQQALAREIEGDIGPVDLPQIASHQLRLNLSDDVIELPQVARLPTGLGEEIRQLKGRMRRIGAINPEAPREYDAILERQTFLEGQSQDLRGAIAGLHDIIAELDIVIERDLTATIKTVDQAFRQYFSVLFGGGTARLDLTDPENISTSGVEIIARPPGKRAQGLALLSGGERALTAVALLFALLVANPVPFCILDEVDAALDEANVGRFRDLLVERGIVTQFVVITHNRRTIDAAETIYGISMSEQGVSQHVSLKLERQAAQTAPPAP